MNVWHTEDDVDEQPGVPAPYVPAHPCTYTESQAALFVSRFEFVRENEGGEDA